MHSSLLPSVAVITGAIVWTLIPRWLYHFLLGLWTLGFLGLMSLVLYISLDLYLSWRLPSTEAASSRTRRYGAFAFASPAAWSVIQTRSKWEAASYASVDVSRVRLTKASQGVLSSDDEDSGLSTSQLLSVLARLITNDFVLPWYSRISDSPSFPCAFEAFLKETAHNFTRRLSSTTLHVAFADDVSAPVQATAVPDFLQEEPLSSPFLAGLSRVPPSLATPSLSTPSITTPSLVAPSQAPMLATPASGSHSNRRRSNVDWAEVLVGRFLPLLTRHLDTFKQAEIAIRGGAGSRTRLTESEELDLLIAKKYASLLPERKLHDAVKESNVNSEHSEDAYLMGLVARIVPLIAPEREIESASVQIILRDIVACSILKPLVDKISDPDLWNKLIDQKAGDVIRDQQMVHQFRQALDKEDSIEHENLSDGPLLSESDLDDPRLKRSYLSSVFKGPQKSGKMSVAEEISATTSTKQFDRFVKGISRCDTLLEAKRIRADLLIQIRRTKGFIENKTDGEVVYGIKVYKLKDHVKRLYYAKTKLDKRIDELGGSKTTLSSDSPLKGLNERNSATLKDILVQPMSMSYFMEFEDRRNRSIHLQFWILVEGLKDPLEKSGSNNIMVQSQKDVMASPELIKTTREDLALVWSVYFATNVLSIDKKLVDIVDSFVHQSSEEQAQSLSQSDLNRIRNAVFSAQDQVLEEMNLHDFPDFKKTDLYFKALANIPSSSEDVDIPQRMIESMPELKPLKKSDALIPEENLLGFHNEHSLAAENLSPQLKTGNIDNIPSPVDSEGPSRKTQERAGLFDEEDDATFLMPTKMKRQMSDPLEFLISPAPNGEGAKSKRNSLTVNKGNLDFLLDTPHLKSPRSAYSVSLSSSDESKPRSRDPLFDDVDDRLFLQEQEVRRKRARDESYFSDAASLVSIEGEPDMSTQEVRRHTMEAIREALDDIVSSTPPLEAKETADDYVSDVEEEAYAAVTAARKKKAPMFVTEDDEDTFLHPASLLSPPKDRTASLQIATPGDLQLNKAIEQIDAHIVKLEKQAKLVETMIKQAELTGLDAQLKVLSKSEESLKREIGALQFQKEQYQLQDSQNKLLPDRTKVSIPGTTIGKVDSNIVGDQSFQLYIIEVHQLSTEGTFNQGWIVTRRYSEFSMLHSALREKYVNARRMELPPKRPYYYYNNANKENFIEQRRLGLEKYLQNLIKDAVICQSDELKAFLSQQNISLPNLNSSVSYGAGRGLYSGPNLMRSFYKTLTSGVDDIVGGIIGIGNDAKGKPLSTYSSLGKTSGSSSLMDTLLQRLSQQAVSFDGPSHEEEDEDLVSSAILKDENGMSTFTEPICDLLITLFELKEKNNWLRKQAIMIIFQQMLGGTIERKFRESVKMMMNPEQVTLSLRTAINSIWPDGHRKPAAPARTLKERADTRESARLKLSKLMPAVLSNLIGNDNAKQGARKLFMVVQNKRLNKHLIYSMLDETIDILFPELGLKKGWLQRLMQTRRQGIPRSPLIRGPPKRI